MPDKKRPRVVVVGSLVFDCVAIADRIPRKGETVLGQSFGTFSGGKGANQAVAAARLGAEVFMVGRVGQDDQAKFLLTNLNASGVNTEFVKADPVAGTGACCIHVDAAGDNTIIIVPQANLACLPEDVDAAREVIAAADAVVCQLEIAIPAVVRAVDLANELGVPVILNPAPAGKAPAGLFAKATYLTPNETEAEFFTGVPLPGQDSAGGAGWRLGGESLGQATGHGAAEGHHYLGTTRRVPGDEANAAADPELLRQGGGLHGGR